MPVYMYSYATYHTRNIALHTINHHRIPRVNGVAQLVVLADTGGAKAVAAGDFHSMVLNKDDTVLTTGWNNYGQLGVSNKDRRSSFDQADGACNMWLWSAYTLSTPVPLPSRLTVHLEHSPPFALEFNIYSSI